MTMKKSTKITLFVVAAILVGLAILCYTRWGAWFGNPIEPPYQPSDSICRVQLTFGRAGAQSRAVSWQCGDHIEAAELLLTAENATDTQDIAAQSRLFETTWRPNGLLLGVSRFAGGGQLPLCGARGQ